MKSDRRPLLLLALIASLTLAAGVVLGVDNARPRADQAGAFQRLVGGLGFGPAVDLSRCGFSFDPRLCPSCPADDEPIPGGVFFCPRHGCSILYYPRLTPPARPE